MKKWTITVNLLFYITFLNQWKAVESQQTSSSRGSPSAGSGPAGGQTSTPKSQNQSASSSSQSQSSQSSSQPASSGSRAAQQTGSGAQPSRASSTPASQSRTQSSRSSSQAAGTGTQSQPEKPASQPASPPSGTQQPKATGTTTPPSGTPTGGSTPSGTTPGTPTSQTQSAKPASTPTSGTQPPKTTGTGTPASQSGTTPAKTAPTSGASGSTQPPKTSSGIQSAKPASTPQSSGTQPPKASGSGTSASQTPASQTSSQSTGTGTSAGQVSQSPITESQPKSSSSATDQSSSVTGESQEGQLTEGESEVIAPGSVQQTSLAILTEDAPANVAVTVIAPIGKPRPSKTPEVATGNRTAVTLNIAEKASNDTVDFNEDYLKNVMVFSAKEKCVFNKIVEIDKSETVIWVANNKNEHFERVYVDGLGTFSSTSNLSLHLCNGTFKHFNKSDSGGWKQYPGVVDLDVRISNSNIQVDFFKKDNYRIYVAKPGYTIRKVMKSKKCSSECCCSPKVIWEAQSEHALKVVLMGSKKEPKHLAVLMKSGELTLLYKSGKGEPWEDITSSKNKITDLRMYAMADKESVELHRGHYSITLFNEFYGYLFYEGIDCVKVIHKGKNIWDLKEERDFGCLKGVFLDLKSNKFNVMNDDDRYWVCEEVRKVNPVTLDISSKASTDDFDFTVDHNRNINVYTSKGNAMFNQVIKRSTTGCCGYNCCDSETVIWVAKDPQNYASKVFADGLGACSSTKNVSIYLLNGDILHFSEDDNVWKKSDHKIILDVDKTSSTIGYDFVHHGESRTFTTKPGYLFKTIMVSKTFSEDHTFWEAKTDEECSTKVTVYGVQTNVKNINIFLNNDEVKHFHKVDDKWVTKTTIVLDIDKNTDNDLFEYRSTRNYGHFNPKPNLAITMIVKKGLEIWNAQPEDHGLKAVLMGSGWGEKHLSILLQSGNFVLLRKAFRGYPWKDITKEKSDFSGIKMYSLEEGTSNYHELNGNDYDPIIFESRYGYEFKEGVKCVKITYNNKLLWSHTDDPEYGYLKGLYLDLPKNQFIVSNLKDQTKEVDITVALDIKKTEGTREFYYFKDDDCQKYSAKSGHVFNKIVDGPKVIWQSSDNVFANLARTKSKDDGIYLAILLTNRNFKLFKEEDNKWNDITSQRSDITKLKFLGDKDTELKASDFKVTIADYSYQFKFNDGVKCKKVMYGDEDVWKPSDDPKFSEIKSFSLGLSSNSFIVKNQSDELKKLEFKPTPEKAAVITKVSVTKPAVIAVTLDIEKTQSTSEFDYTDQNGVITYTPKDDHVFSKVSQGAKDIWQSKNDVCGTLVRTKTSKNVKFLVVLLTNNMFKVFNLDDADEWKDITSKRHDVKKLKFLCDNDAELSKNDYTVSIVDLSFTYIFNDGVSCKKVKLGDDEVWKHTDDSKFADIKSFSLGLASNSFFVKNKSDEVKKIEKEAEAEAEIPEPETPAPKPVTPEETKPVTPPAPKPVTKPAEPYMVALDINETESTSRYLYSDKNGIVTYRVKSGYRFTKVTQGSKGIWEYKDLYGRLVMTKLFSNDERFLAIIFYNNTFRLFRQSEEGTSWEDITSERGDVTKFKFLSHNDHELRNVEFTVSFVDFFYIFNFRNISKCLKVTYGNQDVWMFTRYKDFSDINTFYFGIISNRFYVRNRFGQFKKIEKELVASTPAVPTQQPAQPAKPQAEPAKQQSAEPSQRQATPSQPAESGESTQSAETDSSEHSIPDTSSASSS